MRGRLAAACAAVLVGMSPAGALPATFVAAIVSVERDCVEIVVPRAPAAEAARVSRDVAQQPREARVPSIFRTPSGPAPSRAPPAAA